MHKLLFHKITYTFLSILLLAISFMQPLDAARAPKEEITEWVKSCPYIGLLTEKITYGPITLKDFNLADVGRVVIVDPDEVIEGTVKYKVDSNKLDTLHLHHIIVGVRGEEGSQSCISHTLGILDTKGTAKFSLKSPSKKGIYEIRFDYQTALTCSNALEQWIENPPSASAVVGFLIVK